MVRLTLPSVGTIVTVEGDLEESMRVTGWVDVAPVEDEKPRRGRTSKATDK